MSRLAWFPLYVDDFLGGTSAMLVGELGAYLAALLAQWQSGDLQAIPDDSARLARICGGEPFPPIVRAKFKPIRIDGVAYLRNTRLALTWEKQKTVHNAQVEGAKHRSKQPSKQPSKQGGNHDKNPEPITHNLEDQSGERSDPPALEASRNLPEGLSRHPAVVLYWERYRIVPAIITQEQIEATIGKDLPGWIETLDFWQSNDYRPGSVGKMLDRYREQSAERDPVESLRQKYAGPEYAEGGRYCPPRGMTQSEWEKVWNEKQGASDGETTGSNSTVRH